MLRFVSLSALVGLAILAGCAASRDDASNASASSSPQTGLSAVVTPATSNAAESSAQNNPSVATDGKVFLAAWTATRLAPDGSSRGVVEVGRVDAATGAVLDDHSLALGPTDTSDDGAPAVAYDGTNFVVAFPRGTAGQPGAQVNVEHITPVGALVEPKPVVVAGVQAADVGVASTATSTMVIWNEAKPALTDVAAGNVVLSYALLTGSTPAGNPIGALGPGSEPRGAAIAATADTFMIAYGKGGYDDGKTRLVTTRFDAKAENPLDPQVSELESANDHYDAKPSIATDGTSFTVAWSSGTDASDATPRGVITKVDAATGTVDPLTIVNPAMTPGSTAIAYDGTSFITSFGGAVTRQSDSKVFINGPSAATSWSLVSNSKGTFYVLANGNQLDGAILTGPGAKRMFSRSLARTVANEQQVVAAHGLKESLVVWVEADAFAGEPVLRGSWLLPNGNFASGSPFTIATSQTAVANPAVVFDGTTYIVGWNDKGNANYATVAPRADKAGSALTVNDANAPHLVMVGSAIFSGTPAGVRLISRNGSDLAIHNAAAGLNLGSAKTLALGTDGKSLVVAWSDATGVFGQRIGVDGTTVGKASIPLSTKATTELAIASDVVAWRGDDGIHAETLGATKDIVVGQAGDHAPTVSYNGQHFVIGYTRTAGFFLSRWARSGGDLTALGTELAVSTGATHDSALTALDPSVTLITYASTDATMDDVTRVRVRSYVDSDSTVQPVVDAGPTVTPADPHASQPSDPNNDAPTSDGGLPPVSGHVDSGCSATPGVPSGVSGFLLAIAALFAVRRRRN